MVASDRISAYGYVLAPRSPTRARSTRLSPWWFERLADLLPHHVLSTDLPPGAPAEWSAALSS